jgi:superfamily I DNA/RNA helicase
MAVRKKLNQPVATTKRSETEAKRKKAQKKNAELAKQFAAGARAKPSKAAGTGKAATKVSKTPKKAKAIRTKYQGESATTSKLSKKEYSREKRRAETGKPAITPKEATRIIDNAARDAKQHGITRAQVKSALERAGLTPEVPFAPISINPSKERLTKDIVVARAYEFPDGFIASPQQGGLFNWIEKGTGNAFVEAVAGSGKTTSLLRAIQFMNGSVVCIAFGAKIAAEFKLKILAMGLAGKVEVMTAHACGYRALRNNPDYRRTVLCKNFEKSDAMLQALKPAGYQEFPPQLARAVVKLVDLARQSGVMVTWDLNDLEQWEELADHHSVDDLLPEQLDPVTGMKEAIKYAINGVRWSLNIADKMIEFSDMCWVPLVKKLNFPKYDWVLIDEAQDLSEMRRLIAGELMGKNSRMIAVGDRHQAIFGFTGADADSVDRIIDNFKCTKLPLTVTYRCTKAIAKEAAKIVPHIVAHDEAVEGEPPRTMSKTEFEEKVMMKLTPDDVILCRINRPLVSLAFRLIRAGVACHVEGRSIGDGLISLAKKWKSAKTVEQLDGWLTKYLDNETARLTAKKREAQLEAVRDRVETLRIIMEGCEKVTDVVFKIEGLFKDTNGDHKATVTLSSVHKFKGREKLNVYILGFKDWMPGPWAKKTWEQEQEQNLIYVAQTRAMLNLVYLEKLDEDRQ